MIPYHHAESVVDLSQYECTKLDSISPLPPPLLPKTYSPPHDESSLTLNNTYIIYVPHEEHKQPSSSSPFKESWYTETVHLSNGLHYSTPIIHCGFIPSFFERQTPVSVIHSMTKSNHSKLYCKKLPSGIPKHDQ